MGLKFIVSLLLKKYTNPTQEIKTQSFQTLSDQHENDKQTYNATTQKSIDTKNCVGHKAEKFDSHHIPWLIAVLIAV